MVDRNIVNKLGLSQEQLDQQVSEMFGEKETKFLEKALETKVDSHLPGTIIKGTIVTQIGNDVIVEVGLKSEGVVDASEFDSPDEIVPGKEVEVLLEDTDSEGGLILLSKRKADRIRSWERIIETKKEGDVVKGRVIRRIKGGLLVDIGVSVFLPASQVDIRKPGDISRFIGKEIECKILKIDVENRNIVISRRKLIEEERLSSKEKILSEVEAGQLRRGIVKNIADFGVFVDLGGVDGLLHISDLSWGRVSHPSEVVQLDQEIECVVIGVDREKEKISLGLKQKTPSPWEKVEEKYPIGAKVKGRVVNIMNYGVFARLENGIEGLVHISEMSWTKRISHPSEMLKLDDEIEVVVLSVNKEKQEISLGLKQTEINPWTVASQKYPPGTIVNAKVRGLTNFGAFVEIEEGIDGMIHISDLSWTRKYNHPSEALQKGREVKCVVLEVNEGKQRISLGMKQLTEDPWVRAIPEKYIPGHIIKGKIVKLTNFGAFVELEPELEGLLHISELADHKVEKPQDIVKEGDEVEVKILKVDTEARKIGLSLRRAQWAAEEQVGEAGAGVQTDVSAGEQPAKPKKKGKKAEPEPAPADEQETKAAETASGSEVAAEETKTAEGETSPQASE
jgi:small subunit ribosomal protein S1